MILKAGALDAHVTVGVHGVAPARVSLTPATQPDTLVFSQYHFVCLFCARFRLNVLSAVEQLTVFPPTSTLAMVHAVVSLLLLVFLNSSPPQPWFPAHMHDTDT